MKFATALKTATTVATCLAQCRWTSKAMPTTKATAPITSSVTPRLRTL
jgi:hypothetical protein